MSAGDSQDYKFGTKNHWRRTMWNAVVQKMAENRRGCPVLYLAGPDDLDREVAISKGIANQNLIAIDRSDVNVSSVRKSKCPAINADVFQVLANWPESRFVSAVVLDLCCGLDRDDLGDTMNAFCRVPFQNSVIAVNLMRGRDGASNNMRAFASKHDGPMRILQVIRRKK